MSKTSTALLTATALGAALALHLTGARAADLPGSLKDGGGYAPPVAHSSVGNCYMRGDVGYSLSNSPSITWPVSTDSYSGTGPAAPGTYLGSTYIGDSVGST